MAGMEGTDKKASSGSSLASDLFDSNSKEHSSTGFFESIFSGSSKGFGREALRSETTGNTPDSSGEDWNRRFGTPGNRHAPSTDIGSYFQDHKVQPCHLSSSIYYGGQDVYSQPSDGQNHGSQPPVKKYEEEDDGTASRGNWWKGSLYY